MSPPNSTDRSHAITVGINLPQYDVDFAEGRVDPDRLLAYAATVEALGFDGIWISDHPYVIDPNGEVSGAFDALALLGALGQTTSTIEVGTLVLAGSMLDVATVRHLARSLEFVCPGRGVLGLGAGWNAMIHAAFGIPLRDYEARVAHLRSLAEATSAGTGGPQLLIGGWGSGVLDTAARYASRWNVAWDVPARTFRGLVNELSDRCRRFEREPAAVRTSIGLTIVLGDAHERRRSVDRLRARVPLLRDREGAALLGDLERRALVGDAESCAEKIRAYGAHDVVLTPLLRDDATTLDRIATELLPILHSA